MTTFSDAPIRVLELRSVSGTGGGPEKTILFGTAQTDPSQFQITVCYLRSAADSSDRLRASAQALGIEYVEIVEKHSLDVAIWRQLLRIVQDRNIQIIHSHEYKTDLLAWLACRYSTAVPLATAHGWTGQSWKERWLYYPGDKRILAKFPHVIAVSTDIKSTLVAAGCDSDRVTVVLNGIDHRACRRDPSRVDAARSSFELGPDDIAIGSVGRLEPQKRFDLLLRAFAKARATVPHARLLVAGEGSERTRLETMRRELGLEDSCRLLGHVSDTRRLYHALDVFVQSSDYEGTPNAVLEAMAFEAPVVATDAGGTAELVAHQEQGIIVPCGDPETLGDAIVSVITEAARTRDRVRAARAKVESELSFETRMRKVEVLYRSLAGWHVTDRERNPSLSS